MALFYSSHSKQSPPPHIHLMSVWLIQLYWCPNNTHRYIMAQTKRYGESVLRARLEEVMSSERKKTSACIEEVRHAWLANDCHTECINHTLSRLSASRRISTSIAIDMQSAARCRKILRYARQLYTRSCASERAMRTELQIVCDKCIRTRTCRHRYGQWHDSLSNISVFLYRRIGITSVILG